METQFFPCDFEWRFRDKLASLPQITSVSQYADQLRSIFLNISISESEKFISLFLALSQTYDVWYVPPIRRLTPLMKLFVEPALSTYLQISFLISLKNFSHTKERPDGSMAIVLNVANLATKVLNVVLVYPIKRYKRKFLIVIRCMPSEQII